MLVRLNIILHMNKYSDLDKSTIDEFNIDPTDDIKCFKQKINNYTMMNAVTVISYGTQVLSDDMIIQDLKIKNGDIFSIARFFDKNNNDDNNEY